MRELAEGVPALAPKIDPPHRWHGGGYPPADRDFWATCAAIFDPIAEL